MKEEETFDLDCHSILLTSGGLIEHHSRVNHLTMQCSLLELNSFGILIFVSHLSFCLLREGREEQGEYHETHVGWAEKGKRC